MHEPSDVNVKIVVTCACLLFIGTVSAWICVKLLLSYLEINRAREEVPLPAWAAHTPLPPPPRLEVFSGQDLQKLRAQEAPLLDSYRWADKTTGTVDIPIDRAEEVLAQRGLPARPAESPKDHLSTGPMR